MKRSEQILSEILGIYNELEKLQNQINQLV
jgi:hypothetical protein